MISVEPLEQCESDTRAAPHYNDRDELGMRRDRNIRVVFSAYDWAGNISGVSTWICELLPRLREFGVDSHVDVLAWDAPGFISQTLRDSGISSECTVVSGDTEQRSLGMAERVLARRPDLYVANNVLPGLLISGLLRRSGIPTVGVLHAYEPFYQGVVERFVSGREQDRVSAMVCVSDDLLRLAASLNTDPNLQLCQIPCGVTVPAEVTPRPVEHPLTILYAGRFTNYQKRISDVAEAMRLIVRQIPGSKAIMVGDGCDAASVREILRSEISDGLVELTGALTPEKTRQRMSDADIFLLLSDFEGLPVALLEAMGRGLVPVVCHIRSGVAELVQHGQTGLVVDDRGHSVVNAVRTLRDDANLRGTLARNGRSRVIQAFSSEVCTEKWAGLLRILADSRLTLNADIAIARPLDLAQPHLAHHPEDTRVAALQNSNTELQWWKYAAAEKVFQQLKRIFWKRCKPQ